MKKTLLTLLLGLLAVTGYSQARFDIHGGMSMANITNSEADMKWVIRLDWVWIMPLMTCGLSSLD